MTRPNDDDVEEKPLDPAVARVQQRLRAMMLIAGATLGIGLLAVLFAIAFRVLHLDRGSSGAPYQSVIEIASKGTIVSTSLDGDRVAFLIEGPDGRIVEVHDMRSGELVARSVLITK